MQLSFKLPLSVKKQEYLAAIQAWPKLHLTRNGGALTSQFQRIRAFAAASFGKPVLLTMTAALRQPSEFKTCLIRALAFGCPASASICAYRALKAAWQASALCAIACWGLATVASITRAPNPIVV
jgi:hypothetical protein